MIDNFDLLCTCFYTLLLIAYTIVLSILIMWTLTAIIWVIWTCFVSSAREELLILWYLEHSFSLLCLGILQILICKQLHFMFVSWYGANGHRPIIHGSLPALHDYQIDCLICYRSSCHFLYEIDSNAIPINLSLIQFMIITCLPLPRTLILILFTLNC